MLIIPTGTSKHSIANTHTFYKMTTAVLTSHSLPFKRKHHGSVDAIDLRSDDGKDGLPKQTTEESSESPVINGAMKDTDDEGVSEDGGSLVEDILDQAEEDPYTDRILLLCHISST